MLAERSHVFHAPHPHLSAPFGAGGFGLFAERLARFFGTPWYLVGQTAIVIVWVIINAVKLVDFDLYPFILLNLAFSLQAAYAAPLILLAETRQAGRDKAWSEAEADHRQRIGETTLRLLEQNTDLTRQVASLTEEVHRLTTEIHSRIVR
jgi:uncharacterized membrane protein